MNDIGQPHIAIGFQPADDNVLVRLVMTEGASENDTVEWGDVVAVGAGRRMSDGMLVAPEVAPGDRVALRPRSPMQLHLDGQSFAIVGGTDVLGVLLKGEATKPLPTPEAAEVGVAAPEAPALVSSAMAAEESLETDVAPDLLDREAPTSEDLH